MRKQQELRRISQEELDAILIEHEKWLDSDRFSGKQAYLGFTVLSKNALPEAFKNHSNLSKVQFFGAHLQGANLMNTRLHGANLSSARLDGAQLGAARMNKALLIDAHLEGSHLDGSEMEGSILIGAHLHSASLEGTNLCNTNLRGVSYDSKIKCRGIRLDGCYGSPRFERFLRDQDYLEELRGSSWRGKFIYSLWKVFADCGRSVWPWALWSLVFVCWFALQYWFLGPNHFKSDPIPWDWETAGYYSVITFTTLGFGDVVPKSHWAARLVVAEVITGYVMLGGLISIFANKLARRAS